MTKLHVVFTCLALTIANPLGSWNVEIHRCFLFLFSFHFLSLSLLYKKYHESWYFGVQCKYYCDLTFYHSNYALFNLWLKFHIILTVVGLEKNNGWLLRSLYCIIPYWFRKKNLLKVINSEMIWETFLRQII